MKMINDSHYSVTGEVTTAFKDSQLLQTYIDGAAVITPLLREGYIELNPEGIDFEKTYTFEETDENGMVHVWSDIKPERGGGGSAVFRLPPKPVSG